MQNDYPLYEIIDGISNQDYHRHKAISSTQCKHLLKSAWEFDYKRKHPKAPSTAMKFGSLVHQLVLEPESFEQNYFVADKPKRNTKEGKAMYARLDQERGKREWISLDDFLKAEDIRHNLKQSGLVQSLLSGGKAEQSVFWGDSETDILCRAKADYINVESNIIVDLKTTSSLASELSFKSEIYKYNYHLSAAFYQDGFNETTGQTLDFIIIAVETFAPHNYAVYTLNNVLLAQGRALYREALGVYFDANMQGNFAIPYNNGNLVEMAA